MDFLIQLKKFCYLQFLIFSIKFTDEQHVGGLAGPLIIRSKKDAERNTLYSEDLYSHSIFVQDLVHEKDDLKFPFFDDRGRFLSPSSYLINGRGQYKVNDCTHV